MKININSMEITKQKKLEELDNAESDLTFAKHRLLRNLGWENSCSNPAAMWLWVKNIDGLRYTLDTEMALRFERNINA